MSLLIHQLTFERDDRRLFDQISLKLNHGELLQVTGANGAGKSTFLRLLAKLIQPTNGSINASDDFFYLGHQNGNNLLLTARENLIFTANLIKKDYSENFLIEILKQAGLEKLIDTQVKYFSAGQARRLALAKLLLKPSKLWLLDEPTTALDVNAQQWFKQLLTKHLNSGGIAVIATHEIINEIENNKILNLTACDPEGKHSDMSYPLALRSEQSSRLEGQDVHVSRQRVALPQHERDNRIFTPEERFERRRIPRSYLYQLIYYEILASLRASHAWMTPLIFSVMAITLFPLAVGPDLPLLHSMAPGIIWVITLLAILLSIENIFRADSESGRLDFVLSQPKTVNLFIAAKIITHWLIYILPFVLLSPLLGLTFGLNFNEIAILSFSLFTGTISLSLIGITGAAIVTGIRGHGLLLPILIIPLYIPILIFGTGLITAANQQQPINAYCAVMLALTLVSITFTPIFTKLALKIGVDQ